jgi:predicted kinase
MTPNPSINLRANGVARALRHAVGSRLARTLVSTTPARQSMHSIPTLHFFCGKAGAGKTTIASRLAKEQRAILISEDVCMMRLFGDQLITFDDYIRLSKRLKEVIGHIALDILVSGQSVVLDFQANTKIGREWFRSVFEQAATAHVLHFVDTPDKTCLARIAKRNSERPEGSHHLTEEDFIHISSYFQAPHESEGFNIITHTSATESA